MRGERKKEKKMGEMMGDQTKPCSQILKEGRKQNKQKKNGNNGG
jgi:hypothetical protein